MMSALPMAVEGRMRRTTGMEPKSILGQERPRMPAHGHSCEETAVKRRGCSRLGAGEAGDGQAERGSETGACGEVFDQLAGIGRDRPDTAESGRDRTEIVGGACQDGGRPVRSSTEHDCLAKGAAALREHEPRLAAWGNQKSHES